MTSFTHASATREAVAEYMERQIVSGQLPPGAKLPSERQLAERFGVSRPIVREALRVLVERNLIEVLPARGAYVRSVGIVDAASRLDTLYRMSPVTPRQLTEARMTLETSAARLAAERTTSDKLQAIQQALERCERATNILEQARHDFSFHHAIVRASGNPVIEVMFVSISSLTFQLMLRSLNDKDVTEESLPYHRAVFDAIEGHRAGDAALAMQEHLDIARRLYGSDFDASLESIARREIADLIPADLTVDTLIGTSGVSHA